MRGLGISMILLGILGAVLIFLYPTLGWSGLVGCVAAVLAGVGFAAMPCDETNR